MVTFTPENETTALELVVTISCASSITPDLDLVAIGVDGQYTAYYNGWGTAPPILFIQTYGASGQQALWETPTTVTVTGLRNPMLTARATLSRLQYSEISTIRLPFALAEPDTGGLGRNTVASEGHIY